MYKHSLGQRRDWEQRLADRTLGARAAQAAAKAAVNEPATGRRTFLVTDPWLMNHSTNGSTGWTRKQLQALGVSWPPTTGWKQTLIGRRITAAQRRNFESARTSLKAA
jgi:hypothetical protein